MSKASYNSNVPHHGVKVTAQITGLSRKQVTDGMKSGVIPCVTIGAKKLVNVPLLLKLMQNPDFPIKPKKT